MREDLAGSAFWEAPDVVAVLAASPELVVSFKVLVRLGLEAEDWAEDSDAGVLEITGVLGGGF